MSSPASVIYGADPATIILVASALRAAQAIQEGWQQAQALRQSHEQSINKQEKDRIEARHAEEASLQNQLDEANKRYLHLIKLAQPYGIAQALKTAIPQTPDVTNISALATHIEQIKLMSQQLEGALKEILDINHAEDLSSISLEEIESATDNAAEVAPDIVARLVARIASLGKLPVSIEKLAEELAKTRNTERKKLVELELRREIQAFQEKAVQEASAVVLEHTLKDLGYQVEPISETLFVEDGIVHFRRPGWGNYMVRLRIDAKKSHANFNVIRAVEKGENERSVLDHIAEDRWCAEFPAFLKALEARGLHLQITRLISAGEYPVQLVEKTRLPQFEEEERMTQKHTPLQRALS